MCDKYTPGLLAVNPLRPNQICTADGALEIAAATVQHSIPTAVSNARRIVACVNACEGISTENLEDNRPVKWVIQQYNNVVKQRDELLKALMLAESVYRQNCVNEGEPSSVLDAMQAAILKATGAKHERED